MKLVADLLEGGAPVGAEGDDVVAERGLDRDRARVIEDGAHR